MNEDPPIEESAPEESASGASDTVVPSSSDNADLGQSGKLTGTVLGGRYELRSEIGRGGMGAIYLARDLEAEDESASLVAVKVLLQQIGEEEQSRNRFLLEARAVSSLAHPGVVKVKEYSITSDGMPYIVMDFLPGKTLDKLLAEGAFDIEAMLDLVIQICDAIGHAHRRNVIHRDMKPGNIIVVEEEDGTIRPVLVDFGLAKIFSQTGSLSMHLTQTGQIFGSPPYMSPEQCQGLKITPATDIYSLGCILYEAVTGDAPFTGDNPLTVIFQHIHDQPRSFAGSQEEELLEKAIFRALAKESGDRFESILDLRNELARCKDAMIWRKENPDDELEIFLKQADLNDAQLGLNHSQLKHYEYLANNGFVSAQLEMAVLYRDGIFVEKDGARALEWCLKAASQGYVEAMTEAGAMFFFEQVVPVDHDKAFYWTYKAAQEGSPYSMSLLGYFYEQGFGAEKDIDQAIVWYEKAAALEDIEAQKALGNFHRYGIGFPESFSQALNWYRRAAEQGDSESQNVIAAWLFDDAVEGNRSFEEAFRWAGLAAEGGQVVSMRLLAYMHEDGLGTTASAEEAVRWMTAAADNGDTQALLWLARGFTEGEHGLEIDLKKANRYFRMAADLGDLEAHLEMALVYLFGAGVARNYATAARWLKPVAEDGHPYAIYLLSTLYRDGNGVRQDEAEYLRLLEEAAEGGLAAAQFELGSYLFDSGKVEEARSWWELARDQGSEEAADRLNELQ
ncbi:MAG: SEL1-like repeat protein [Candidatus Obscuribacterales bacterium]|nr:SEL1-like repeat protein [Candidatus Obscuribacterales bacterium]